jgi:hypothetical protein
MDASARIKMVDVFLSFFRENTYKTNALPVVPMTLKQESMQVMTMIEGKSLSFSKRCSPFFVSLCMTTSSSISEIEKD